MHSISTESVGSPTDQARDEDLRRQLIAELADEFSASGIRRRRRVRLLRSSSWWFARRALTALKRIADLSLAVILVCCLSPILLFLLLSAKKQGGRLSHRKMLGRWAVPFRRFRFEFPETSRAPAWAHTPLAELPALFNALRGEMSFIGPRAVSANEISASERNGWKRFDLRPGFLSPWWLRKRGNIDYVGETDLDAEYVDTQSLLGDLGIALRSVPALAYGRSTSAAPNYVRMLGVTIANLSMAEAVDRICGLAAGARRSQVCFLNADCANLASRNARYKQVLESSEVVLADGIGVRLAGQILNQPIRQNVNGTDLLPLLCAEAARRRLSIFLLGGRPEVAKDTARWMREREPSLEICGVHHGYYGRSDEDSVMAKIRESGTDILLVAFGAPKQDLWIADRMACLGSGVAIGVGGLFDFYSGRVPRAPVWMREIGMEWFFRFLQEPGRMWRRYFVGNAVFLSRILIERWRLGRGRRPCEKA